MASRIDATHPNAPDIKLSKKHRLMIDNVSGNCWYVNQHIKMSLYENSLAGKKMQKHNRANLKEEY